MNINTFYVWLWFKQSIRCKSIISKTLTISRIKQMFRLFLFFYSHEFSMKEQHNEIVNNCMNSKTARPCALIRYSSPICTYHTCKLHLVKMSSSGHNPFNYRQRKTYRSILCICRQWVQTPTYRVSQSIRDNCP